MMDTPSPAHGCLLLNKGDWFTVKMWVRDYDPKVKFSVEGGIVDISAIQRRQVSARSEEELVTVNSYTISRGMRQFSYLATILAIVFGFLIFFLSIRNLPAP